MKKILGLFMAFVLTMSSFVAVYANNSVNSSEISDENLQVLTKSGAYSVIELQQSSLDENRIVLERYDGTKAVITKETTAKGTNYHFSEDSKESSMFIDNEGAIFVDGKEIEVTISDAARISNTQLRSTNENWITSLTRFDPGPYRDYYTTKQINIPLNREIGSFALSQLLILCGGAVPSLATLDEQLGNLQDFVSFLEDLQLYKPDTTRLYVEDEYYISENSSTSGRPLIYYYKIYQTYYTDSSFSTPSGFSEIIYGKQLLYV